MTGSALDGRAPLRPGPLTGIAVLALLAGCSGHTATDRAEASVRARLRDPDAAAFRNERMVTSHRLTIGRDTVALANGGTVTFTCGEVATRGGKAQVWHAFAYGGGDAAPIIADPAPIALIDQGDDAAFPAECRPQDARQTRFTPGSARTRHGQKA
jgi:hypothetical protein